jgi:hypothetical protein
MFYFLHLLLILLPLQLLIVSLVITFQSSSPQHRASRIHRKDALCAPATKKGKKADINVGIVHTSQAFVQHLASKFTTLNETEH